MKRILVTGGAGFIGSHLCNKLKKEGHDVLVFDSYESQVHKGLNFNKYNINDYEYLKYKICNSQPQWIFHLAAKVGVGQSQYEIKKYVDTNIGGTANLLNILANTKHKVEKLMVASSMSVYGESSIAATEETICNPVSIYALTKKAQEDLVMNFGKTYNFPVTALRLFNTYGTGQTLSNPYTGIVPIFLNRLLNGKPPVIYEDGQQTRDFTSVHDVVDACIMVMENNKANQQVFNVATGIPTKIIDVVKELISISGINIKPKITNTYRKGDVRHCNADITKIKKILGWKPKISLYEGLKEVVEWARKQKIEDKFDVAQKELERRKLIK